MNCDNPGPRWKPRYWACRTWWWYVSDNWKNSKEKSYTIY
jgi:hypothetical protein